MMSPNLYNDWVAAETARLRATERIRKATTALEESKLKLDDAYKAYRATVEPARQAKLVWEQSKEAKERA